MARRHSAARRERGDFWLRVVMVACLLWAGVNLARLGIQEARLTRQHWILYHEQQAIDAKRADLQAKVAEARSHRGAEHLARKILVLARPAEIPVVFLPGATGRIVPNVH